MSFHKNYITNQLFCKHNGDLIEISGSRSGEYEDDCLMGCCAV
jgi:hypothetical protein